MQSSSLLLLSAIALLALFSQTDAQCCGNSGYTYYYYPSNSYNNGYNNNGYTYYYYPSNNNGYTTYYTNGYNNGYNNNGYTYYYYPNSYYTYGKRSAGFAPQDESKQITQN